MKKMNLLIYPFLSLFAAAISFAADRFEVEFYSFDGQFRVGAETHTFARFTRLEEDGKQENVDISWMPVESQLVQPGNRMPRLGVWDGKNYTLEETIRIAGRKRIEIRGKFEISAGLFRKAKYQRLVLESGRIKYRMLGQGILNRTNMNCIHAVSSIVGNQFTTKEMGRVATDAVIGFYSANRTLGSALKHPNLLLSETR